MTTVDTPGESPPPWNSIVKTVIREVAESTGRQTADLPPLYETVDPEALVTLVASARRNGTSMTVQFTYAGSEVTVDESGAVRCTPQ